MNQTSTRNRNNTYCCVPQCNSSARKSPEISFHLFPREVEPNVPGRKELRNTWIRLLKIGKKVSRRMVVCSRHFRSVDFINKDQPRKTRRLKIGAIPSVNLPLSSTENRENIEINKCKAHERHTRRANRQLRIERRISMNHVSTCPEERDVADTSMLLDMEMHNNSVFNEDEGNEQLLLLQEEKEVAEALLLLNSNNSLSNLNREQVKEISTQVNFFQNRLNIIFTDSNLKSISGIPTENVLEKISQLVANCRYVHNRKLLTVKEEVLLTMMRIKLNISFSALSCFWKCTATTCKNIFDETVKDLSIILKSCVRWVSKEEVMNNMPKQFEKFKNVRAILDCTEIKMSKPKCLKCQIATYSHYKKTHTLKYLVSISPGGIITYISNAYGGKASDKKIFVQSGLLSMLEPFVDSIMVDKGFLIDKECEDAFISVVRPPFMKNKRYTIEECNRSKAIAGARVHVERAIQRMKIFGLTQGKVPYNMVEYMDDVLLIVCALANLNGCIYSDIRF